MNEDKYFDEENALSALLKDGILFCNERNYSSTPGGPSEGLTIVLFVICNDIFAWGCADAEDLPISELENLYKMWLKNNKWGSTKWCCIRRKEKPQRPAVELMKKDGAWDDELECLSENRYDALFAEKESS